MTAWGLIFNWTYMSIEYASNGKWHIGAQSFAQLAFTFSIWTHLGHSSNGFAIVSWTWMEKLSSKFVDFNWFWILNTLYCLHKTQRYKTIESISMVLHSYILNMNSNFKIIDGYRRLAHPFFEYTLSVNIYFGVTEICVWKPNTFFPGYYFALPRINNQHQMHNFIHSRLTIVTVKISQWLCRWNENLHFFFLHYFHILFIIFNCITWQKQETASNRCFHSKC